MTKRERYAATVAQYLEEFQRAIERNEVGIHEAYVSDTVFEFHVRNEHGDIMESSTQSISIWEGVDELAFNAQGHITSESVSAFFRNNADYMPPPFLSDSELERAHKVEFVVGDKMVSGEWDSFVLSISIPI